MACPLGVRINRVLLYVGSKFVPHTVQMSVKFHTLRGYIFVSIPQITFKRGFFLIILRRSFQCRQWIFSNLFGSKVEKNAEGSIELRSTSAWGCLGGGGEGRECLQGHYCPRHSTTH